MEEHTQHLWCIMLYYFKKGKNATEMQKKICAAYGEGAVTDWMCQKWFVKFHARDFLLYYANIHLSVYCFTKRLMTSIYIFKNTFII